MEHPLVHLNGTSRQELIDQIANALDALTAAERAMQGAWPNARDYYPKGPGAWETAVEEHSERFQKLAAILNDYNEIAEKLILEAAL